MWLLMQTAWFSIFPLTAACWLPTVINGRPKLLEWLGLSSAVGYLLSILMGWLCLVLHLSSFEMLALLLPIGALGAYLSRRSLFPTATTDRKFLVIFFLCVVISLVPRFYFQVDFGPWPRGWDPMFHLGLARAAVLSGGIPWTMEPLEQVQVNYPWGSHLSIISLAHLSNGSLHIAFAAQNSLILSALTALAMAFLAWRCFGSLQVSLWSLLILLNVMHYGGADYQNWGGLPNHAGIMLFLVAFGCLHKCEAGRLRTIGVLLLAGVFYIHHHVMIVAVGVLLVHAAVKARTLGRWEPLKHTCLDIGAALFLAAPVTLPLLSRVFEVGQTTVLRFRESFDWLAMWREYVGVPGLLLGSVGLVLLAQNQDKGRMAHLTPVTFLAALLLMFGLTAGVYPLFSRLVFGQPYVAFTPSRFLTDAANPMAMLAGYAIVKLLHNSQRRILALILLCLFVFGEQWLWMGQRHNETGPDRVLFSNLQKLVADLPFDAAILARFPGDGFAPYLTARECFDTQRPISEPRSERIKQKLRYARILLAGQEDHSLRLKLFGKRSVWILTDQPLPAGATVKAKQGRLSLGYVPLEREMLRE